MAWQKSGERTWTCSMPCSRRRSTSGLVRSMPAARSPASSDLNTADRARRWLGRRAENAPGRVRCPVPEGDQQVAWSGVCLPPDLLHLQILTLLTEPGDGLAEERRTHLDVFDALFQKAINKWLGQEYACRQISCIFRS